MSLKDVNVMSAYRQVVTNMHKEKKEEKTEEKVERQRKVTSHNTEFANVMNAYQIVEKDMATNDIQKALAIAKQKFSTASPEQQQEIRRNIEDLTSKLALKK